MTIAFDWCVSCRTRTGTRKFRQLHSGKCLECWGNQPPSFLKALPEVSKTADSTPKPPKAPKPPRERKQPAIKEISPRRQQQNTDEETLRNYLEGMNLKYKQYWLLEVSERLGWEPSHTKNVYRRLQRKHTIKKDKNDDLIIDFLSGNKAGATAKEIAASLNINLFTVNNCLQKLVKMQIVKKRLSFCNRYSLLDVE